MKLNRSSAHNSRTILALLVIAASVFFPARAADECENAKLTLKQPVTLETPITWNPSSCAMVVQVYIDFELRGEEGKAAGVPSGSVTVGRLTGGKTGKIEAKIWKAGSSRPAHAVWIIVRPER